MPAEHTKYLGDGAYVRIEMDTVCIYTANGEEEANHVYLGFDEMKTLFGWYTKLVGKVTP